VEIECSYQLLMLKFVFIIFREHDEDKFQHQQLITAFNLH